MCKAMAAACAPSLPGSSHSPWLFQHTVGFCKELHGDVFPQGIHHSLTVLQRPPLLEGWLRDVPSAEIRGHLLWKRWEGDSSPQTNASSHCSVPGHPALLANARSISDAELGHGVSGLSWQHGFLLEVQLSTQLLSQKVEFWTLVQFLDSMMQIHDNHQLLCRVHGSAWNKTKHVTDVKTWSCFLVYYWTQLSLQTDSCQHVTVRDLLTPFDQVKHRYQRVVVSGIDSPQKKPYENTKSSCKIFPLVCSREVILSICPVQQTTLDLAFQAQLIMASCQETLIWGSHWSIAGKQRVLSVQGNDCFKEEQKQKAEN